MWALANVRKTCSKVEWANGTVLSMVRRERVCVLYPLEKFVSASFSGEMLWVASASLIFAFSSAAALQLGSSSPYDYYTLGHIQLCQILPYVHTLRTRTSKSIYSIVAAWKTSLTIKYYKRTKQNYFQELR